MASKELIGDRSTLEKKRAVKEERLQSHLQNYLNDVSARRSLAADTSDPSESVDAFLASFSHSRDQVDFLLCILILSLRFYLSTE